MTAPVQPKEHWLSALLQNKHSQPKEERIIRQPIGFDFNREPFDPSSYYKQLGTFRDISRAATNIENVKSFNRAEAERQREQDALRNSLTGIEANFTYGPGGLGKITSNVANAAKYFGSRHGISNIGGWRAKGSVPGSDHPKGRALDFMTSNKAQGTALASDLIKNAKKWNVSYVIWYKYIWSPGKGWRPYSGPSPHTDHVHASFYG